MILHFIHLSVSPVNIFSKFLISANCELDESLGTETSNFCPGYSDAIATPYPGTKETKLQDMADVFCTHCPAGDNTCSQLFCAPDRVIVSVAMAMMSSFCDSIQSTFSSCYSEFCASSVDKREALPQGDGLGSAIECTASPDWSTVSGMDQWCQSNCKSGNDPITCPERYCQCQETEVTTVSVNSLQGSCIRWEASVAWSGVQGMDSWCQSSCAGGWDCPESHCQCVESIQEPTTTTSTTSTSTRSTSSISSISTTSTTTTSIPTTSTTSSTTSVTSETTSSSSTTPTTSSTTPTTTSSTTPTTLSTTPTTTSTTSSTISVTSETTPTTTSSTTTTTLSTTTSSTTPITSTTTPTTTSTITPSASATTPTTATPTTSSSTTTSTASTSTTTPSTTSTSTFSTSPAVSSTTSTSTTTTSTTSSATTPTTPSTTTASTASRSISTTTPSTTSTTSSSTTPTTRSTTPSTTPSTTTTSTAALVANLTDADSQYIVSQMVCDHAISLNQNLLSDRYCQEQAPTIHTGYSSGILDQVLSFAPKILCALTNTAGRSDTCPNMFCGESPLSQQMIRSSLCSVCQEFSDTLSTSCANAYCS